MERQTALKITEYKGFGGSMFDSIAHAALFRDDEPYQFGVMTSRLFSSTTMMGAVNKRWTYLTIAKGNYYTIPGGKNEYDWSVVGDADIEFRITKKLETSTTPGKGGALFDIALDRNWVKEPVTLKTESDNAPLLEIIGQPEPLGAHSWKYTVKLQDGNPNSYLDPQYLEAGKIMTRGGTRISNEENTKYGTDSYAGMEKLRSVVGQHGDEVKFTDKFIRQEMAAAKKGVSNTGSYEDSDGKRYRDGFGRGKIYQANLKAKGKNDTIQKGFFITKAEERLLERVEMDREIMCEWGRLQVDIDRDSRRVKKSAPGWRQLVRDGQYFPHGGSFTLNQLYDWLHQVFYRRRGFKNRKPYLCGGTGAISYLSTLIAAQASIFQTTEPGFGARKASDPVGVHENEYEWGYQFTSIKLPMGVVARIMYDPIKDDDRYFKEKAPGSYLPLESFQIDILEFGKTEDAAENASGENIFMAVEDNVDYYFSVSNAIDWKRGVIKSGENIYRFGKNLEIYRELSGSIGVWDTGSIGRIEWIPGLEG